MNKSRVYLMIFITVLLSVFTYLNSYADIPKKYDDVALDMEYTVGDLSIISYSESWRGEKLKALYNELLNNFHGKELSYLSKIYIYPYSKDGANGSYYDDIYFDSDGKYKNGGNAYIELYNGELQNTVEKMARTLAHEYAHHYTISNITAYENLYYSNWANSEYSQLRGFENLPVNYDCFEMNYEYKWDVTEIAAEDYVQLFSSPLARRSEDYCDVRERLNNGITAKYNFKDAFNIFPQSNKKIKIASEVEGLYEYMLRIGGFTGGIKRPSAMPEIKGVYSEYINELGSNRYKVVWSPAEGGFGSFEYTAFMYPEGNEEMAVPIKTVTGAEPLEAYFGSDIIKKDGGQTVSEIKNYEGKYAICVHVKDRKGFVYKSEPYYYTFSTLKQSHEKKSFDILPKKNTTIEDMLRYVVKYII